MSRRTKPERTVDQYIAALAPDVAFIMERLREAIREAAPDVAESIKYDMPLFRFAGSYLYAGAWKRHIGMYPIYPAKPALEQRIAPYRAGKDTVQFRYSQPIPYDLVQSIALARVGARPGQ